MSNPKGNEATLVKYTPKWRSGKTKTIRVPIAIADQVLEVARKIDNDEAFNTDTSESSFDRDDARNYLEMIFSAPSNKGGHIKELVADLGNLIGFKIEKIGKKWSITDTSE
ncbi:MAG: hypothetical protein QNJ55_13015 [Xenococcus sp. MO_188.B8]|nr:hypothetical protein [Xenococcus sp. MO_188.B8]